MTLRDNDMTGSIPTELGQLTGLDTLWLHNNRLTAAIPSELGLFTMLFGLHLSGNDFSGPIPTELAQLTLLEMLTLHGNDRLSGLVPESICSLGKWNLDPGQGGAIEVGCDSVVCPCDDDLCLCLL